MSNVYNFGNEAEIAEYRSKIIVIINQLVKSANLAIESIKIAKDNKARLDIIDFISNVLKDGLLTVDDLSVIDVADYTLYKYTIISLNSSLNLITFDINNAVKMDIYKRNKKELLDYRAS